MKKHRRSRRKLWIILFFLMTLMGCVKGKEPEEKIELTIIHGWGSTEKDHAAMCQIYQDFESKNPDIILNMVSMPSSTDVISKVGDLLAVGNVPDIIFTGGEGRESIYDFMVEHNYAMDLSPYLETDASFAEDISPVITDYWRTKEGKLYTVSDVLLMGGYWYNEEIFENAGIEKAPATWEEWMEVCEKLSKMEDGVSPMILDADHISYLMTAILADENKAELEGEFINTDAPAFANMLERLKEISKYAVWEENYTYRDTLSAFNAGESAIYINGAWANLMIDSDIPVAYAPFPSEDGKGIATQSACVGYILGNTGDEKRMHASVEFLKYMLSETTALRIMETTGQIPSNPNVEITAETAGQRLEQAVKSVKNAGLIVETPENLWNLSEKKEYGKNVILFLQGELTMQELCQRL